MMAVASANRKSYIIIVIGVVIVYINYFYDHRMTVNTCSPHFHITMSIQ